MNAERLLMIIREPIVSEKTTRMADRLKQFTFSVLNTATKQEIKLAVEHLFNVKVKHVTVLNVKGKTKRFKQRVGVQSDWKKAYVSLQPGYDIDFTVTE